MRYSSIASHVKDTWPFVIHTTFETIWEVPKGNAKIFLDMTKQNYQTRTTLTSFCKPSALIQLFLHSMPDVTFPFIEFYWLKTLKRNTNNSWLTEFVHRNLWVKWVIGLKRWMCKLWKRHQECGTNLKWKDSKCTSSVNTLYGHVYQFWIPFWLVRLHLQYMWSWAKSLRDAPIGRVVEQSCLSR